MRRRSVSSDFHTRSVSRNVKASANATIVGQSPKLNSTTTSAAVQQRRIVMPKENVKKETHHITSQTISLNINYVFV